ncbi:hypothetical protein A2982_02360 [candidate division WWE3 bacterium RIFCSPLOWO2_01_FULL_39_13]|uniref:Uncharacterized protein n=1 Tax=candidate division WWE3 bacterium RIFCSPLOWO2_01_FULL_39_13 TaxID=1802624 RepID=A0A1F4V1P0_UNCKA|nr:MAG: hypothetical protein A2982_02360 [candidate division WWE3 bacterium RIFCSPLOWO2_01_FULL_39_13]
MDNKDTDEDRKSPETPESLNPDNTVNSQPSAQTGNPVQAPPQQANMSAKIKIPKKPKKEFSMFLSYLKTFFVIIIELGIILMVVMFVIIPQYNRYLELPPQLKDKKAERVVIDEQVNYLRNISELGDKLDEYSVLSKQAIPVSDVEIPYYLNQLLYMAEQSNVTVTEQSYIGVEESDSEQSVADASSSDIVELEKPDPMAPFPLGVGDPFEEDIGLQNPIPKTATAASKIAVKMGIEGTYEDLTKFLEMLEKSRRLMNVAAIEFSLVKKDQNSTDTASAKKEGVEVPAFHLNMSIMGYFLEESDASGLDVKVLISKPVREGIITTLSNMDYYYIEPSDIEVGKINPFEDTTIVPTAENTPKVPAVNPGLDIIPPLP